MGNYYELEDRIGAGKHEAQIRREEKAGFFRKELLKLDFASKSMVNSGKWYKW